MSRVLDGGCVGSALLLHTAGSCNEDLLQLTTLQALEGHEGSSSEDEDMAHHESQGPTYVQEQQQLRQAFLQVHCTLLHQCEIASRAVI
jgi:hypothetical protein